jgi:transaldolase
LIFSRARYAEVMEAYLRGLEQRAAAGWPLNHSASVASFFVSRVDTYIDPRLAARPPASGAAALAGQAAIANARLAYADYQQVFTSARFAKLRALGARVQRPLWASTSTKNAAYRDVVYVEELIGPDTVNTIPPQTLTAFLDHGQVRPSLTENLAGARQVLADLEALGIALPVVTQTLEDEGVKAFMDAFAVLLKAVEDRRQSVGAPKA